MNLTLAARTPQYLDKTGSNMTWQEQKLELGSSRLQTEMLTDIKYTLY